jgi:pseudouridine-5'-phosphate glycosidase
VPATIAVWHGQLTVGLADSEIEKLAQSKAVLKASRRDLALAVAQGQTAATTVAATLFLAHLAGIRVLATGGIGGAHRGTPHSWDVSADLAELARTPVAVVCAGAKSMLDIPRTLEILESESVPVIGYRTNEFPAFHLRSSGEPVPARVDTAREAAALLKTHWQLNGAGVVLAQAVPADVAMEPQEYEKAFSEADKLAQEDSITGPALTPFLLAKLAEITDGKTLHANRALVIANAHLAARIAVEFSNLH